MADSAIRVLYKATAIEIPGAKPGAKMPCPCGCPNAMTCGADGADLRIAGIWTGKVVVHCPKCGHEIEMVRILGTVEVM